MPGLVMLSSHAVGWIGGRRAARLGRRVSLAASKQTAVVVPSGLDMGQLLEAARAQFIRLQAAWDAGDMVTLGALTTPQMLDDLRAELPCTANAPNRTEVVSLQARLLAFDDFPSAWLATIEFTGMIREAVERDPMPFRELWLLTRERAADLNEGAGPAWRLARQQALL